MKLLGLVLANGNPTFKTRIKQLAARFHVWVDKESCFEHRGPWYDFIIFSKIQASKIVFEEADFSYSHATNTIALSAKGT